MCFRAIVVESGVALSAMDRVSASVMFESFSSSAKICDFVAFLDSFPSNIDEVGRKSCLYIFAAGFPRSLAMSMSLCAAAII